jgi:hypothetical protein
LARARQRVFEIELPPGSEGRLGSGIEVVSRTRTASGTKLRAVAADGSPPEGARLVDASTLEEAYLAFMAERGRAAAAVLEKDEAAGEGEEEGA